MTHLDLEPAILCLVGSLFWAPVVYLAVTRIDRGKSLSASEMLWIVALAAAVLPTIAAPALAAAGISLRPPAPGDLGVEALPAADTPMEGANLTAPVASQITFAMIVAAAGLLYVYGVLLASCVWLTRFIAFSLHVDRARTIDHPNLIFSLGIWRRRLGVGAPLAVKVSGAVSSVCVHGVLRPVIIVPAGLSARISFDDLLMMCAHELAHVRRGDCRLFAATAATRILFWFNPFMKRIAARAELAAEQSADALVLSAGADRRAYAACFVEGLKFAADRAQPARLAVPSFTPFDKKSRRDRLDAILSGSGHPARAASRLAIAAAAACAAALAVAQAAFAVHPKAPESPAPVAANGEAIVAPHGDKIVASADGVVIDATDVYKGHPEWGKVVVVRSANGIVGRYARLKSYSVRKGDHVRAGEVIARIDPNAAPESRFLAFIDKRSVSAAAPEAPETPSQTVILAPEPPTVEEDEFETVTLTPPAAPKAATEPAPTAAPKATPETAPAPEAAPAPAAPVKSFTHTFAWSGEPGKVYRFTRKDGPNGSYYVDENGAVWNGDDNGGFTVFSGDFLSDEERAEIRTSVEEARKSIARAKLAQGDAMKAVRVKLANLNADDGAVATAMAAAHEALANADSYRGEAMKAVEDAGNNGDFNWNVFWSGDDAAAAREHAQEAAERARERAQRTAERARDRAEHDADRARQREEARAESEQALREAQQEREQQLREAQQEREEALREAERDREEAKREALADREQELQDREQALNEAQRELDQERAEIAKIKAALQRGKSDKLDD